MKTNFKQLLFSALAIIIMSSVSANHLTTGSKTSSIPSFNNAKAQQGPNMAITLKNMINDSPIINGEINVLFAYTSRAAIQAGGPGELKKNVDNGISLLNEALRNSNIGYTAVIIPRFVEVTSEDQPKNSTEVRGLLDELRKTDGKYSGVHKFRKDLQGDIVCLIFSGYTMGMADSHNGAIIAGQFMVCHYETFGGNWVFPHEFGHNLGAQHDPTKNSNGSNSPYNWKYGLNTYRTVSNNGGVAIPYFSEDRTVQYEIDGQMRNIKLGDRNYDNVKIMKQVAPLAAAMSDNLPSISVSGNAYPAKLVYPASAPMPSGSKQTTEVTNMRMDGNGIMYISYNSPSGGRFKLIDFKDGDGNSIDRFGYNPLLSSNKNEVSLPVVFEKNDYVKLQIDNDYFVEYKNGRFIKSNATASTSTNNNSGNNNGNTNTNSTSTSSNPKVVKDTAPTKPITNTTTSKNSEGLFNDGYYRITNQWQGEAYSIDLACSGEECQPFLSESVNSTGQKWRIKDVGNGIYTLSTKAKGEGLILECVNGENKNKPILKKESGYSGGAWKIIPVGNGYYRIQNLWLEGTSLDVINDGDNKKLQVAKTGEYSGQFWKITEL